MVTVYRPGSRSRTRNDPSAPLTVVRTAPVSLFVTVTVAPGIFADVASVTTPASVPKRSWAIAEPALANTDSNQ